MHFSKFNKESFLSDIDQIDWEQILISGKSLDEKAKDAIDAVNNVANKHVPKKLASRKKQKLLDKPWITSGILKSIKKKQKMYHTHFLSNNPRKVIEFKKYANLLAHLKEKTKKEFYRSQFEKCKNNLKTTWKLVGTLVNRKTKGQIMPNKILADIEYIPNNQILLSDLITILLI